MSFYPDKRVDGRLESTDRLRRSDLFSQLNPTGDVVKDTLGEDLLLSPAGLLLRSTSFLKSFVRRNSVLKRLRNYMSAPNNKRFWSKETLLRV